MNRWSILIRREFWENRSLWIAPLSAALFMIVGSIALAVKVADVRFDPPPMSLGSADQALDVTIMIYATLILGVGSLAGGAYLLDCLYTERKDRSILFWKSLPVSDAQTVLAKAAVVAVVLPVGLYALTVVTHLAASLIVSIAPPAGSPMAAPWHGALLVRAYLHLAGTVLLNTLWYAPLMAYAMLASVLSRRSPLVTAALPLVVLAAGERALLGSSRIWLYLWRRISLVMDERMWVSPQLWGGALLAVGIVLLVIRLRRYRDDT